MLKYFFELYDWILMQTYQQLQQALKLERELPFTPDWSAAADFLFLIKEYCLSEKPQTIVECSSGLTTLTLSRCCQLNKQGHVYSLENGEEYQQQSKDNLYSFGLEAFADVFYAPLIKTEIQERDFDWYNPENIQGLKIDMLVIDGPPGFIQKHSRFPALPVLFEKLADDATVFLDDAARQEERELVDMWLNMYDDLEHKYIETERGCSVLKKLTQK